MITKRNWHSKNQRAYIKGNNYIFSSCCKVITALLTAIFLWASPASALTVSTSDYRVQLLTDPTSRITGQETLKTLKILHVSDRLPVQNGSVAFRALLPMVVLSFVLVTLNVYLLNLPMAPRHIH
jgi:hypothetical protein